MRPRSNTGVIAALFSVATVGALTAVSDSFGTLFNPVSNARSGAAAG